MPSGLGYGLAGFAQGFSGSFNQALARAIAEKQRRERDEVSFGHQKDLMGQRQDFSASQAAEQRTWQEAQAAKAAQAAAENAAAQRAWKERMAQQGMEHDTALAEAARQVQERIANARMRTQKAIPSIQQNELYRRRLKESQGAEVGRLKRKEWERDADPFNQYGSGVFAVPEPPVQIPPELQGVAPMFPPPDKPSSVMAAQTKEASMKERQADRLAIALMKDPASESKLTIKYGPERAKAMMEDAKSRYEHILRQGGPEAQ